MLRKIIGAIAGLLAAMFIISVTESLNAKLYPLPKGIDIADRQAMQVYISSLPKTALIIVLAGWAIASFVCGLLIRMISKSDDKTPAYLAGLLLMTAGIVNMFSYENPLWFVIIGVLIFIPLTLYGFTMIRKKD
jgi:hypothetical protein